MNGGRVCADCGHILWPILPAGPILGAKLGHACPHCDRMDLWPNVQRSNVRPARDARPFDWERD